MAPAVGTSLKSLPQSSNGRLLVMMVERFSMCSRRNEADFAAKTGPPRDLGGYSSCDDS
jgi:hypothetical protein